MAAMLGLVLLYVLAYDFIPKALLVIIGITLVWFPVALINGQSVLATAWRWWLLFKYPFAGIIYISLPRLANGCCSIAAKVSDCAARITSYCPNWSILIGHPNR